jgi:ABC-type antimicrobial peptide transport system permease subunit
MNSCEHANNLVPTFQCETGKTLNERIMKKGILFLLVAFSFTAKAQSLKDLLYSGKLKNDSNTVVRKTDDLKSKIDTVQKKTAEDNNTKITGVAGDSSAIKPGLTGDSAALVETADSVAAGKTVVIENAPVKSSSKIWKEYTDSLVKLLKAEVLSSKKIKNETYYLTVEYEIETDGQVSVINVFSAPENEFLQQQVKERLLLSPPQLSPVLDSTNKPRKVKRRQNFTITKE